MESCGRCVSVCVHMCACTCMWAFEQRLEWCKVEVIAESGGRAIGREKRNSKGLKEACLMNRKISVAGSQWLRRMVEEMQRSSLLDSVVHGRKFLFHSRKKSFKIEKDRILFMLVKKNYHRLGNKAKRWLCMLLLSYGNNVQEALRRII